MIENSLETKSSLASLDPYTVDYLFCGKIFCPSISDDKWDGRVGEKVIFTSSESYTSIDSRVYRSCAALVIRYESIRPEKPTSLIMLNIPSIKK